MITYRQILLDAFSAKQTKNPSYSVRAFARDLGLASSHLYDILAIRTGLSLQAAKKVVEKLELGERANLFLDLVEAEHGRSSASRANAKKRIAESGLGFEQNRLQEPQFDILKNWFNLAVLDILNMIPTADAAKTAEVLGISEAQAKDAFDTLTDVGILKKNTDGTFVPTGYQSVQASTPKSVFRDFHKQLAQLCIDRIDTIPMAARKSCSSIISFDSNRINEAREFLDRAHDDFLRQFQTQKQDDSVYSLSTNFLQLGDAKKHV